MQQYQKDFVDFMLEIGALKFGEFTPKSGRISPYFFNAGAFNTTTNVNGIRAAEKKGFFDWIKTQDADVVCLQEIKAQEDQLDERFYPKEYHCYLMQVRLTRVSIFQN
jgi:hypothetical protein